LRPVYRWNPLPFGLDATAKKAWKAANPRKFLGKYGGYGDNRFYGLNCGYRYGVRVSKPQA
jgi:hypothetical protein